MTAPKSGMFQTPREMLTMIAALVALVAYAGAVGYGLWRIAVWGLVAIGLAGCAYDPGGSIRDRVELVRDEYRAIDGYCASACTMHIANGCVTPTAWLVFHGPSYDGRAMPGERFDHWSRVMAGHYPDELAAWFMAHGRVGQHTLTGQQVIEMGAVECHD